MYTPPVTPPCSSAGITCRYELSFEIRLSVSKSPFGSDSRSTSAASGVALAGGRLIELLRGGSTAQSR